MFIHGAIAGLVILNDEPAGLGALEDVVDRPGHIHTIAPLVRRVSRRHEGQSREGSNRRIASIFHGPRTIFALVGTQPGKSAIDGGLDLGCDLDGAILHACGNFLSH